MTSKRLDTLMVERGLAESRERAKALILSGNVFSKGQRLEKAGMTVDADIDIELKEKDHPYVSRGGVKLDAVLTRFGIDPANKRALDIGASTGGFTDRLLRGGALSVTALDVGRGQIDWKLRADPRVRLIEGFNARTMTPENFDAPFDIVTIDVSFISLEKILAPIAAVTARRGIVIALVKPQFEAGRSQVGRGGIVRDPDVHRAVVEKIKAYGAGIGLTAIGEMASPITGAKGNREFFVVFQRDAGSDG